MLPFARAELRDCDVALVGSYFPDGIAAIDEVLASPAPLKAFYDIDTPITIAQLREHGGTDYLRRDQIPGFDVYFSFTGGPMLKEIENRYGARLAVPLYCSFDPQQYRRFPVNKRFACDFSYMGTYAPDRQPKIEEFFCAARPPASRASHSSSPARSIPKSIRWPANVRRITHLNPRWHSRFYSSSRLTLNVTRRDMVRAGYSPSVRLFEAAASGATIVSDNWPGLDTFFRPQQEILLPTCAEDVARYSPGSARRNCGPSAPAPRSGSLPNTPTSGAPLNSKTPCSLPAARPRLSMLLADFSATHHLRCAVLRQRFGAEAHLYTLESPSASCRVRN